MFKRKPMIVFDADHVLLDWYLGILKFLKDNGVCIKHLEQHLGKTNFVPLEEMTKSTCKETNQKFINDFADSGYLAKLEVFEKDAIKILAELHKEYDFAVVTCIGETDELIQQRKSNLINLYGDVFEDIICIDFGKSKEEPLRKLAKEHNIVAFIDDKEKHLDEAVNANNQIKPFLMSRGVDLCPTVLNKYTVISSLGEIKKHLDKKKQCSLAA